MDLKMMSSKESLSKKWTKLSAVTLLGLATLLPSFGHAKASRSDGYSMKMYCKFEVLKKKTHVGKNWKSESGRTKRQILQKSHNLEGRSNKTHRIKS